MWPPNWGYYYWLLIHAGAKSYGSRVLSESEKAGVDLFFKSLCLGLPCPSCGLHCSDYVSASPALFEYGHTFWRYTVDFHNAVNKRTHKLELSEEEATKCLYDTLTKYQGQTFLVEYWHVLLYSALVFSRTPESCSSEDRSSLLNLFTGACYVLPFAHEFNSRASLLDVISNEGPRISNKDDAVSLVVRMFNRTCVDFGVIPQTKDELLQGFYQKFNHKQHLQLIRAHQIREEDHAKMMALQSEMQGLRDVGDWRYRFWGVVIANIVFTLVILVWIVTSRLLKRKKKRATLHDSISRGRTVAL